MKKILSISTILIFGVGVFFFTSNKNIEIKNQSNIEKLADARLSLAKIQKRVESKIDFILDNVSKNEANLNDKELKSLIQEISIVRAYGKDISKDSKIKLLKIVKILLNKHNPNISLLKKLKDIAITSQLLSA